MSLRHFNLRNDTGVKASLGPVASDLNSEARCQSHVLVPGQHHSFPFIAFSEGRAFGVFRRLTEHDG